MANDLFLFAAETQSGGLLESLGLIDLGSQALLWFRVILGIGLVIFVHELGHFVAAKTFGVKCEKFYVGFDPPMKFGPIKLPSTLGKFRYGETEYGIGIIPLGGYVKMLGQDDDPRRMREEAERAKVAAESDDETAAEEPPLDPRSLPAKPVWQRMIIMSAGVFMNVITGVMFAAGAYFSGVPYTPAVVGGVAAGGPAWSADIEAGGQVVSVDGLDDSQMHFREMRSMIFHAGLETPDRPVPVTLAYDDVQSEYALVTEPHPLGKKLRMIGITAPSSRFLDDSLPAMPESSASKVLGETDGGSELLSYDGQAVDSDSIAPVNRFFDYLYSRPDQAVELAFERTNGTTFTVVLEPQVSKWIGIQTTVGSVTDLVENGPAEKAGMLAGDLVVSIDGSPVRDADELLLKLADRTATRFVVRRGDETVEIEIKPDGSLQTLPPADGVGFKAANNAYGFAIEMPAVVADFDRALTSKGEALENGAKLREVQLLNAEALPDLYREKRLSGIIKQLEEGWKFDETQTFASFMEALQWLPVGTPFRVLAEQPSGKIAELEQRIEYSSKNCFDRGLQFKGAEKVQTATGVKEAAQLGVREAKRRLGDVFRFLKMASRGQVSADQVGGPLKIAQVAGYEAERGISKQLLFLTMLSMNLAILNFLPIPVLDGGHMVFLAVEAIMGRRVNEELEMKLTMVGACMLLALMIFVFYNDLMSFF